MPVMDAEKEKSMPSMEEIEEMYEKIQQNKREDIAFAKSLEKYLHGDLKESEILQLGETPFALQIAEAEGLPLTMKQSDLRNALNPENVYMHGHTSGHQIDPLIIEKLPELLRNPTVIIRDKNKNLRAIIDAQDGNGDYIMCHIALNKIQGRYNVNKVCSVHGKRELANYIDRSFDEGSVMAVNKEKARSLFQSIGCQSSKEETVICFDNSIAYTTANVKSPSEIFPENSHEKNTEKLLPILNAVHQKHEDRIENLSEKIAVREDKIAKNTAKIDKLTAKIERLKDTNKMLDGMSSGVLSAPIKAIAERNQRRIERLEKVRIPKRENKIQKHLNRISTLEHKSEVSHAKADKLAALSGVIKSFAMRDPAERRHQFTQNMDALHEASKRALSFKVEKCTRQLSSLTERYAAAESSVDKLNLSEKISSIQSRKQSLTERMKRLDNLQKPFSEHTPEQVDKLMIHTESSIEKSAENQSVTLSQLAENTVVNSADYLRNAELSLEGNYNDIDGVINNLPQEKTENTIENNTEYLRNAELSMEENYNNIDGVINNLPSEKETELSLFSVEKYDEKRFFRSDEITYDKLLMLAASSQEPFAELIKHGTQISEMEYADIQQSDKFKVSAEVNLDNNSAEIYSVNQGKGGIPEAYRTPENTAFETVSLADFLISEQEKATDQVQKNDEKINPEYFESLAKSERAIFNADRETAEKIMQKLEEEAIQFSAVKRSEKAFAITVSKDDEQRFKAVEKDVRADKTAEFINPEYYKQLSKEERYTLRMSESDARQAVNKLKEEGVEHSAVINGDKSAVTVAQKDKGKTPFSKAMLLKAAAQLKHDRQENPQQNKSKNKSKSNDIDL